jgi:hypothetical protein
MQVPVASIEDALGVACPKENRDKPSGIGTVEGHTDLQGGWRTVGDEPSWFMPPLVGNPLRPNLFWTRREPANSLFGLTFLLAFTCDAAHTSSQPWTDMHLGLR